jgi:hypothetical protein
MKISHLVLAGACALMMACATPRADTLRVSEAQRAAFGTMADLAGKTWRGTPTGNGPEDVAQWSFDLGGTVLVSRHVLADHTYGGVSYIYRNKATGALDYVYITSGGFRTEGSYVLNADGSFTAEEEVKGHKEITRVRSTGRFQADGSFTSASEYLTAAGWTPGHSFIYRPSTGGLPALQPKP